MIIDESLNRATLPARVGGAFEVRLPENPTTGFRWAVIQDGRPGCRATGDAYQPNGARPGAGGEHRWMFEATKPGRSRIELVYRRAWDSPSDDSRKFEITIYVGPWTVSDAGDAAG